MCLNALADSFNAAKPISVANDSKNLRCRYFIVFCRLLTDNNKEKSSCIEVYSILREFALIYLQKTDQQNLGKLIELLHGAGPISRSVWIVARLERLWPKWNRALNHLTSRLKLDDVPRKKVSLNANVIEGFVFIDTCNLLKYHFLIGCFSLV